MNDLIQRLKATGDPLCAEAATAFEEIIAARKRRIGVDVSKMKPRDVGDKKQKELLKEGNSNG